MYNDYRKYAQPIVVLFSTHYRTWDSTASHHVKFIKKLVKYDISNVVVGINVWAEPGIPDVPPKSIQELPYLMTKTYQMPHEDKYAYFTSHLFIMDSTREALKNAEKLYLHRYGVEMPWNTTIIRLRPDTFIFDIDRVVQSVDVSNDIGLRYISIWNTIHRPQNDKAPEIADALYFTSRQALTLIIGVRKEMLHEYFQEKRDEGLQVSFHEQYLYHAIKRAGVTVIFNHNLRLGLQRTDHIERLTTNMQIVCRYTTQGEYVCKQSAIQVGFKCLY